MARKRKGPKRDESTSSVRVAGSAKEWTQWWTVERDDVGNAVEDRVRQLWVDDTDRRYDIERNLKRWGLSLAGLYADPTGNQKDALRINLTKSITETITAKVGKNRPRPKVLTDGGHYTNKTRAKKLQRFLDGAYQQIEVYKQSPLLFRNAMLCGTGAMLITGRPHDFLPRFDLENIFPLELLIDNAEGSRGRKYARDLFRLYPENKDRLIEDYPEYAVEIESAAMTGPEAALPTATLLNGQHRDQRMCMVSEAWRKARYDSEGNVICGRHVVSVNGCALLDEDWDEQDWPFIFHDWNAPVRGPWGDSAISETRGLEKEANILLQRSQEAMRRTGLAIVLAHEDAKVKTSKLSNEPMSILEWQGQMAPTVTTSQAVHPQILGHIETLMGLAANQLGTNELQLSATKPAGIESGRALEQLSEEHSVRFDTISKNFEIVLSRDLAIQLVAVAKRMDAELESEGGLRLVSTYKKEFIDLKWKDVFLGPEEFFIDVWPTSVLPHTPAGRTAEVERWQANEWLTADQAKSLLEFPDLEADASVGRASQELLDWQLEKMLDDGEDVAPDTRQDLESARRIGTHAKLKAQREGYPQDHINKLEDFLLAVDAMLAPPPAPDAAPMMPMPDPSAMPDPTLAGAPAPLAPEPMGPGMGATPAALPISGALQLA